MLLTYRGGKGKPDEELWRLYFDDQINESVVRRIVRLTGWKSDSLPARFVSMWRTLSGTVHDKRTPADYQRANDAITVSERALDPESCLAAAALLLENVYPLELDPPRAMWDQDLKDFPLGAEELEVVV